MKQGTTFVPSRTIGIDLSDNQSKYCSIDASGEILQEGSFATTAPELDEVFGKVPSSRIVMEACTQASWIARRLTELGHEVIVANPRPLHLISKSARKTDRNDARMLARLGRMDPSILRPIQIRDEQTLAARALLGARKQLVQARTRLIAQIRTECKVHGVRIAGSSSEAFAKRASLQMPKTLHRALLPLVDVLERLTRQIRHYDQEIEELCKQQYPQTGALRQVRGVGAQTGRTPSCTRAT